VRLWYDVVPHRNGWAISITPGRADPLDTARNSFATKKQAYDVAVELARKLHLVGLSVQVRVHHDADDEVVWREQAS
jgi:hypothetical protein